MKKEQERQQNKKQDKQYKQEKLGETNRCKRNSCISRKSSLDKLTDTHVVSLNFDIGF